MGNADSHAAEHDGRTALKYLNTSKHMRRTTTSPTSELHEQQHDRKRHSLSPNLQTPARSSSLKYGAEASPDRDAIQCAESKSEINRRIQQRRAKSFRNPNGLMRNAGSFRLPTCPVTGLTSTQKKLIEQKWAELDRGGVLEMGRNVFETLFKREPLFLLAVGLDPEFEGRGAEWRFHVNFRVQVQRFCEVINEVIRTFETPKVAVDRVQEFGAAHFRAFHKHGASRKGLAGYWEGLVMAINHAAKDLQVETSSRGSGSPSANMFERRFLLSTDDYSASTPPSPTPLASLAVTAPRRFGSVCPRAAEAWNVLALYVVSQMRFGYEMERLLRAELRRLKSGPVHFQMSPPKVHGSIGSGSTTSSSSDFKDSNDTSIQSADGLVLKLPSKARF